ncbi:type IX secretion system sortase PorU [Chitinophaga vietnamensis]|uniref:type IX secretion system sortase PorU n=1 Tax=Chitinophaga vietnamensis TaxID=2593957 RepID=UPI001178BBF6|nr:type IX secretion system sortase PorU [Chitinophaga vietnamensis]
MKVICIFITIVLMSFTGAREAHGQQSRSYQAHSVLAAGNWYKLAVTGPGIYRIDLPLLAQLGINTSAISSQHIRLYGNGGQMLPEPNAQPRPDDLQAVALYAADGGDGQLNGNDYMLFYAPGPHRWQYDSGTQSYSHQYNIYSDTAWYFLNLEAPGARIKPDSPASPAQANVYTIDYHEFYERDSLNFLRSGKQWFGQEFSLDPAAGIRHSYNFQLPSPARGPVTVNIRAAARGINGSNFNVSINKQAAATVYLLPVSGNVFEAFGTAATGTGGVYTSDPALQVTVDFLPGDNNARGWLDYLEIQAACAPVLPATGFLPFRSAQYAGSGLAARCAVYNTNAYTQIWDVTDPQQPLLVPAVQQGDSLVFTMKNERLHEYVAFDPGKALAAYPAGAVPNQDIHAAAAAGLVIITTGTLLAEAQRLAAWHRQHDQLEVLVVSTDQVYNEFASGSPDPTALRDFLKMLHDRGPAPRYLLLFGAASYDYRYRVKNNTNEVPSWQSDNALNPLSSYVTDDYFGMLGDNDDITRTDIRNPVALGIGRLPARNAAEAALAVDKIIHYHDAPQHFGDWRNRIAFVADEGDNNLHFSDAESVSDSIAIEAPVLNTGKLYLDAWPKVNGAYPDVNKAIAAAINRGVLIFNYSGHGNSSRLAEASVVDANTIADWHNEDRLPLLVTASCDFAPFDNPAVVSLGHKVLLQQRSGAIALMTTTRAVYASSNRLMHQNYLRAVTTPGADGLMPSLGAALQQAKNQTHNNFNDIINNRKFQLLGDPALKLAFPRYRVVTDSINGKAVNGNADTLKALRRAVISGHVEDMQGQMISGYNGVLYTTIYDSPAEMTTRGNSAGSQVAAFRVQDHVLFRGTHTVSGGRFSAVVTIPADASASGTGKISYYTSNNDIDGNGYYKGFTTAAGAAAKDTAGPQIQAWLNNRLFRNGDVVNVSPLLLVDLTDSSGINISGNVAAHNLVAVLDNSEYFVLNDYFEASLDSYSKGTVAFPMSDIAEGKHRLRISAWDACNNIATTEIEFEVVRSGAIMVSALGNYPNPFHDVTRFTFVHNQQGQALQLSLEIFAVNGQLMKTIRNTIISDSSRFDGMPWDGTGESGAKLSPGIYFYRLTINSNGKKKMMGGKLVLL